MILIGCDFHPSFQQIAMLDMETGAITEKKLVHKGTEARSFYESLPKGTRVGLEASGQSQWFERLLEECGHEVWLGDAAVIRSRETRKQKTDRRDALLLMDLLAKDEFPRIWAPSAEQRDLRQLVLHRYKMVRMRVRIKNQLQALALNQGLQKKRRLWSAAGRMELAELSLLPWTKQRREDLLAMLDEFDRRIDVLDRAVCQQAAGSAAAKRLMTHPGVGPVTALAFVLTLGPISRFPRGKAVASYFGLIPSEDSSGGKQRLGHISKQGNAFLRGLLVEAAQSAVRLDPEMGRQYKRLAQRKCRSIAKVAMARKLAVRLYWMLRRGIDFAQLIQGSPCGTA